MPTEFKRHKYCDKNHLEGVGVGMASSMAPKLLLIEAFVSC